MRFLKIISVLVFLLGIADVSYFFYQREKNYDNEGPAISIEEPVLDISIEDGKEKMLSGITAVDSKDGDVTDSLLVENISAFVDDDTRIVSVVAFDSDNHVTHAARKIRYTDYASPHFELTKPFEFPLGTSNLSANLTADDVLDGDITKRILVYNTNYSNFDKNIAGEYHVVFSVSNSAGDISKFTATVTLMDQNADRAEASISLLDYLVYIKQNSSFEPMDYLKKITVGNKSYTFNASVEEAEKETAESANTEEADEFDYSLLTINNPVHSETCGWYEVTYRVQDEYGEEAVTRLLVCVEEE